MSLTQQQELNFTRYFTNRLNSVDSSHKYSVSGWFRDRWNRNVGSFVTQGALRLGAPASIVVGGLTAGGVVSLGAAPIAIPATILVVSGGLYVWGKSKSRASKDEIDNYYYRRNIFATGPTVGQIAVQNNQLVINGGITLPQLNPDQCKRWLGFLIFDGLTSTVDAFRKVAVAQEKSNTSIMDLYRDYDRQRNSRNPRFSSSRFKKAMDDLCYLYRRSDRLKLYRVLRLLVAVSWFLQTVQVNRDAVENLAGRRSFIADMSPNYLR